MSAPTASEAVRSLEASIWKLRKGAEWSRLEATWHEHPVPQEADLAEAASIASELAGLFRRPDDASYDSALGRIFEWAKCRGWGHDARAREMLADALEPVLEQARRHPDLLRHQLRAWQGIRYNGVTNHPANVRGARQVDERIRALSRALGGASPAAPRTARPRSAGHRRAAHSGASAGGGGSSGDSSSGDSGPGDDPPSPPGGSEQGEAEHVNRLGEGGP